ncbi:MAG: hypothetical protein AAGA46_07175 [Cyanobacteria bacterium P01_F01_bin.13]
MGRKQRILRPNCCHHIKRTSPGQQTLWEKAAPDQSEVEKVAKKFVEANRRPGGGTVVPGNAAEE